MVRQEGTEDKRSDACDRVDDKWKPKALGFGARVFVIKDVNCGCCQNDSSTNGGRVYGTKNGGNMPSSKYACSGYRSEYDRAAK